MASASLLSLPWRIPSIIGGKAMRPSHLAAGRRGSVVVVKSSEASGEKKVQENEGDRDATPSFNPFGFVTDNPSSRSAIQLPESPAEDGNVGQMLSRIEDKGKEYGSYVKAGKLRWFVREAGSSESPRGTIIFLHGAPTQSYSYRVVMSQMADAGFHCFAPDWIGFGFSAKPQPGYGFDYTEEEFHSAFDKLLDVLNVNSPFYLVTQGFLVGSYGLTWALKNSNRIWKLVILNSPLTVSSPLPGLFQQLRIPLFGEFTCQNAVMAERFIEAGSAKRCLWNNHLALLFRGRVLKSADSRRLFMDLSRVPRFGLISSVRWSLFLASKGVSGMPGIAETKSYLERHFVTKNLGCLCYFLGIEMARSRHGIILSQRKYAIDLLQEIGVLDCNPADTLMDQNPSLWPSHDSEDADFEDKSRYKRLVGKLIYLIATIPDIFFAVGVVSHFMESSKACH